MSDSLWDGRRYRILNIIDDFNREVLHVEIDTSINATRLIRILDFLKQTRGLPKFIRTDNGPEFISSKLDQWCKDKDNKVTLVFIQPGKPMQNGFIERFNGSMRREVLNAFVFKTLFEVKEYISNWVLDYNNNRPHKALNFLTPTDMIT
jgi:putative transposase